MIVMKQPSLVLHSCDVPGYLYQMKWTWKMPANANSQDVVNWILYAREHSEELALKNVIINCHGLPAQLYIGGGSAKPMGIESVGVFSQLKGKDIGTIWFVACLVAGTESKPGGRNGKYFCSELAKAAGCDVIAADKNQVVEAAFYKAGCPFGCIDDFEGTPYRFSAAGGWTVWTPG